MKNKLEELRKEKGLSQDQFGRLMRVSRQTIISLEKGKYNPSLELAFRIAEFFNLRIEDIFMYKGDGDE
ncbi:helix-turn-helix transcriptional regulator [Clostridium sp. UBA1652]|uniref:helix-turn-helix transcriptional regulator n=1 Tax=Clostridium sp. UBA1652 TaxID=1946348 RepID=UPI000FA6553B|nr:helix-turn-helix transcriptional regulator [Clostridium sp. UBA1652]